MDVVAATPDAIRRYGDASAAMAATTATVGAVDQAATMAAAVPVFGLIGQDFLLSFAYAQANHLASVSELAAVHAGTAVTAYEGAATYETTDAGSAAKVGKVGDSL
ncbi:type VII secretion target [Nocardia sp. CDC159]|uniref:Type VII secretion target n=1 Tax=Nocardia pulmonis TaxID=2951408 RepID=A0A9X2E9E4_9NOCA|nr:MULTISPECIES: type VII secretion target [Nocardia]MCM6776091.1 type VII secretion target [Nocardia pulmonis]MCM6788582.1 type VII secretion target [Nocardia sp. CDC159]